MLSFSVHAQLFAILWTIALLAPLSKEFSRQEYLSELPCSLPGDLPNPGIKLSSLISPALASRFFFFFSFFLITSATWEAQSWHIYQKEELYVINSKISSSVCFYNSNKYCPINSTGENPLYYLWHCSLEAIYLTNSCEKKRNKNQRRKGKI